MQDVYDFDTYASRLARAAARVDLDASHAQREAMNARVGPWHAHGIDIRIEWPKDSTRKGIGADGKEWSRKMYAHYGRITRTKGHDGDPVDVYIGEHPESQLVYVVSQLKPDGSLDEHKCILGEYCLAEAKQLYLAHYPADWERTRLGEIRAMTIPQFRKWLDSTAPVKGKMPKHATESEAVAEFLAEVG